MILWRQRVMKGYVFSHLAFKLPHFLSKIGKSYSHDFIPAIKTSLHCRRQQQRCLRFSESYPLAINFFWHSSQIFFSCFGPLMYHSLQFRHRYAPSRTMPSALRVGSRFRIENFPPPSCQREIVLLSIARINWGSGASLGFLPLDMLFVSPQPIFPVR